MEKQLLKNYIKITVRYILRYKIYSVINISGLAIGIVCCIFILLWVQDELSYDKFHSKSEMIYRIAQTEHRDSGDFSTPYVFTAVAPLLKSENGGIADFVRFKQEQRTIVKYESKQFIEDKFFYSDPSIFNIFDFHLIAGNQKTALNAPYSLIITQKTSEKYFGNKNPIGEIIKINNERNYEITGVLENIPHNSHIKFDFLASFSSLKEKYGNYLNMWAFTAYTYLLIPEPDNAKRLEKNFSNFILKHKGKKWQEYRNFYLQALEKIHLHSNLNYEIEPNGDIRDIYIFSGIAVLILIIACINFMNLSTATSARRKREVGIRKILGANRINLIRQFIGESLVYSILALFFALILVELLMPVFNFLSDKQITLNYLNNNLFLAIAIGLVLFVGIFSGSYPAFFLSSFKPVDTLKGKPNIKYGGAFFRKVLVIFQFSVSMVLLISTLIIYNQLNFIKNEKLGFSKENIIVLRASDEQIRQSYGSLKNNLVRLPMVTGVAASNGVPSIGTGLSIYRPEGTTQDEKIITRNLFVDYDFINTLGINIREGRKFLKEFINDKNESFIINETAARMFGWKEPLGKKLTCLDGNREGTVIGLAEDFHFKSKQQKIEPLVINILPDYKYVYFISIKYEPNYAKDILNIIREEWNKFSFNRPLEYFFLNDNYDALYKNEEKLNDIFKVFTFLAIFVACLGLFGLASFSAEQRTKEIAVRRVVGATVDNIIKLISKEFVKLVLIANIISWSVGYFIMNKWLENFAYRVSFGLWPFLVSGVMAIFIALITVSYQALKAALKDPVDSLRYE